MATSLADAAFAILLGRRLGPVPVLGWMVLTTVLGQVALLRFDMLPAVAAGAAVLLAAQGAGRAASFPARRSRRRKAFASFIPIGRKAESPSRNGS